VGCSSSEFVNLKSVVFNLLDNYLSGDSPEVIAKRFPSLSLEQVYATITYYWANQEKADAYLEDGRLWFDEQWRKQTENPSPVVKQLRELKKQRRLAQLVNGN